MEVIYGLVNLETGIAVPVKVDETGRLIVFVEGLDGITVNVGPSVEISNDSGNPIPVSGPLTNAQLRAAALGVVGTARACVGRQTLDVTAGAVAMLTVPVGAVAAAIQADGSAVSITLDGSAPTAVVGTRIDDGVIYYVDTSLANVKLIARTASTKVQVVYFDKP